MITYPTFFFGQAGGPIKEDFEEYPAGDLPVYDQVWQYGFHQWLSPTNPTKYVGFTWKDFGTSGALDSFDDYSVGPIDITNLNNLNGLGNFEIRPWSGLSAGFYRDKDASFNSADEIRGYPYINFDWGEGSPLTGYKTDFWCAKFLGRLTLPEDGTYKIWVERDQGCRIWVGREDGPNNLIFDQWGTTVPPVTGTKEPSNNFTFSAGKITVLLHFFDATGPARLKLYWNTPSNPGGTPAMILPSDWGDEGYVRIFMPYMPDGDQGANYINTEGAYRYSKITGDAKQDYAQNNVYFSGNYSLGVVTMDRFHEDRSRNLLVPVGYHVRKNVDVLSTESSLNTIDSQGFYAYKVAFPSVESEPAYNTVIPSGHYVYGLIALDFVDHSKVTTNLVGFYNLGIVKTDLFADQGQQEMNTAGTYYSQFLYNRNGPDYGYTSLAPFGVYAPRFLENSYREYAGVSIQPSGYHITGYIWLDRQQDYSKNLIAPAGHYISGINYFDKVVENTTNRLGFEYAAYFYKFLDEKLSDEAANRINTAGLYFPRYSYTRDFDAGRTSLEPFGVYYNKNAYTQGIDYVNTMIAPQGYHITGFIYPNTRDYSSNTINPAGNYVSGYVQTANADFSRNRLSPVGNYFIANLPNSYRDFGKNAISFAGDYSSIYIYTRGIDYARNTINPQGLYYYHLVETINAEPAYDRLNLAGNYIGRFEQSYSFDTSKNNIGFAGHHATGTVYMRGADYAMTSLNPDGAYYSRFSDNLSIDYSHGEIDLNGVYFYRYLPTNYLDQASGKVNLDGAYYYRYRETTNAEPAKDEIDMKGIYFGRYEYQPEIDYCTNIHNLHGYYAALHINLHETDIANDEIEMAGNYFYRYMFSDTVSETVSGRCDMFGNYYPRYLNNLSLDQGCNLLNLDGYLFYTRVPVKYDDAARNLLGFSEGRYFSRYVPAYAVDPSCNLLLLAGEYFKESYVSLDSSVLEINFGSEFVTFREQDDAATITASLSGEFTADKVSNTLDYWLEIYQRPTYNMGKSQAYFSI